MSETHWDRAAREAVAYNAAKDARRVEREAAEAAERERGPALVAWLSGVLDESERVAHAAVADTDSAQWITAAPPNELVVRVGARMEDERVFGYGSAAHIALHDPRAVLARVEAERALLRVHVVNTSYYVDKPYCEGCDDGDVPGFHGQWPCPTLRWLAYGHRFDAPGWQTSWAPDGVEVPQ